MEDSGAADVFFSGLESVHDVCTTPREYTKVWKDECMFCFCSSECDGGLYINLKSLQAFCLDHVELDQERQGGMLYLVEKATKVCWCTCIVLIRSFSAIVLLI